MFSVSREVGLLSIQTPCERKRDAQYEPPSTIPISNLGFLVVRGFRPQLGEVPVGESGVGL